MVLEEPLRCFEKELLRSDKVKRTNRVIRLKKILYYFVYFLIALVFSFAAVGGRYMDELFGRYHIFEISIKSCLILLILIYAFSKKELHKLVKKKFFSIYLLAGMIPFGFQMVTQAVVLDEMPEVETVVGMSFCVLTTVIWEELYFRYIGRSLFENKDGTYAAADVILLSVIFCVPHFSDVFFYDPVEAAFQMLAAFGLGIFLLALYRKTENIFVVITSHFMNNMIIAVYRIYGSGQLLLEEHVSDIIFSVGIALNVLVGLIILWNNQYFQDKRF